NEFGGGRMIVTGLRCYEKRRSCYDATQQSKLKYPHRRNHGFNWCGHRFLLENVNMGRLSGSCSVARVSRLLTCEWTDPLKSVSRSRGLLYNWPKFLVPVSPRDGS